MTPLFLFYTITAVVREILRTRHNVSNILCGRYTVIVPHTVYT